MVDKVCSIIVQFVQENVPRVLRIEQNFQLGHCAFALRRLRLPPEVYYIMSTEIPNLRCICRFNHHQFDHHQFSHSNSCYDLPSLMAIDSYISNVDGSVAKV